MAKIKRITSAVTRLHREGAELAFEISAYCEALEEKLNRVHAIAMAGGHWLDYEDDDLVAKSLFGAIVAEVETNEAHLLVEKTKTLMGQLKIEREVSS